MDQISFKEGYFHNLQEDKASISAGDLCLCKYQDEHCDDTTNSIGTIAICNDDKETDRKFTFIMPPPGKQGRVLCTQDLSKGPKYSADIVLGGCETESGKITIKTYDSEKKSFYDGVIQPPATANSMVVWQTEGVTGQSYWPMYANDGVITYCDSVLGSLDKPFSGMYFGKKDGYGEWKIQAKEDITELVTRSFSLTDFEEYLSLAFTTIVPAEGESYNGKIDLSFALDKENTITTCDFLLTNNNITIGLNDNNDNNNNSNKFSSSLHLGLDGIFIDCSQDSDDGESQYSYLSMYQNGFEVSYNNAYLSLWDERFEINLGSSSSFSMYDSNHPFIELSSNICINSEYSYSKYHPTDENCPLANKDTPYEGQIYFTILED